ncbi:MAG: alpha-E domain-containing protein [Magnetococcales bacterium]|nr:alpha-E domain-containing protein [Magnetococcales bacterium]
MLSRVAENIYWMGRYLERAENTARLINVTSCLLLDQPELGRQYGWKRLVTITGCDALFTESGRPAEEGEMVRFLVGATDNPASLFSSISCARATLRTMRNVLPQECWEKINTLSLFLKKQKETGCDAARRHFFLEDLIEHCQTLVGILIGTLSRGPAFDFFRMGQHIERADMCTRILDVEPALWQLELAQDALWINLLRSVSGEFVYRRYINPRINAPDVVAFLLRDRRFPRSFNYCLHEMERCIHVLNNNALCFQLLKRLEQWVDSRDVLAQGPSAFMDELQLELNKLHDIIARTYF